MGGSMGWRQRAGVFFLQPPHRLSSDAHRLAAGAEPRVGTAGGTSGREPGRTMTCPSPGGLSLLPTIGSRPDASSFSSRPFCPRASRFPPAVAIVQALRPRGGPLSQSPPSYIVPILKRRVPAAEDQSPDRATAAIALPQHQPAGAESSLLGRAAALGPSEHGARPRKAVFGDSLHQGREPPDSWQRCQHSKEQCGHADDDDAPRLRFRILPRFRGWTRHSIPAPGSASRHCGR